jgi:hypothetical protein
MPMSGGIYTSGAGMRVGKVIAAHTINMITVILVLVALVNQGPLCWLSPCPRPGNSG